MRALTVSLLFVLASAGGAAAQEAPLERARQAYSEGRFDAALPAFDEALRTPGHAPAELAEIHFHLGILRALLGDMDAARRAFDIALVIAPDLSVPPELGPDLGGLFEEAREALAGRRIEVQSRPLGPVHARRPVPLAVRAVGAPEGLVRGFHLRSDTGWEATAQGGAEARLTIAPAAWGDAGTLRLRIEALDSYLGVLAEAATELNGPALAPPTGVTENAPTDSNDGEVDEGGGVLASPWFWLTLGVLVAGGVTAGVLVATAEENYVVGAPTGP